MAKKKWFLQVTLLGRKGQEGDRIRTPKKQIKESYWTDDLFVIQEKKKYGGTWIEYPSRNIALVQWVFEKE